MERALDNGTLSLIYEWTHFLVHTNDRPKTAFYRRLWQSHRLHHFKNENYRYGVSMLSGDRLLGTQPDHHEVETSPTCRTLGREDRLED
ncbi:MAG: sterol desaturase family protein [Bradymonadaceae bacterium]